MVDKLCLLDESNRTPCRNYTSLDSAAGFFYRLTCSAGHGGLPMLTLKIISHLLPHPLLLSLVAAESLLLPSMPSPG
jgi:hypothetical protein